MLGHVSFGIADKQKATAFYDGIMALLGYVRVWDSEKGVGYGPPNGGDMLALFVQRDPPAPPGPGFHVAFVAPSRGAVDEFYSKALAGGAADAGPPGLRTHYTPTYYAAFVVDPFGYKLEFYCEAPE